MSDRIDVFISSTSKDLVRYRQCVDDAVMKVGMHPIMMEDFNPSDANALQVCYDQIQSAELFVGIYAYRYGYIPDAESQYKTVSGKILTGDGKTSVTHWEYLWAKERGIPIRLFVVAEVYPPGHEFEGEPISWPLQYVDEGVEKAALEAFKAQILKDHVVAFFHSSDDLASKVSAALAAGLVEIGRKKAAPAIYTRAEFYKHIPLPQNYVPRPELVTELRGVLLGESDVALTSAITTRAKNQPTVLHGMGGIGKSVVARALCDDPAVQAAFEDGILWTTLGQEPTENDITKKLREWVTALGGQITENAPSADTLKNTLIKLLEDRACLLVVDDMWRRTDAEWFRVGGPRCRMLLTTRDTEVAKLFGASVTPIPLLPLPEAVRLLEKWVGGQLDRVPGDLKAIIAQRVGRLPLALKLAGAQLQYETPENWLRTFDASNLETDRVEEVHDSLARTFKLSLDKLNPTVRQLYASLTIFKEDEQIHEAGIRRLWAELAGWNDKLTEKELRDLAARALLELVHQEYSRTVILHDLLRDLMAAELVEKGIDPVGLHQKLLDGYRYMQPPGSTGWHTVPDDGYLYDHLAYHLKAVNNYPEMKVLFDSQDWLHARVPQSDYLYDGYIADVMTTWRDLAHPEALRQVEANTDPMAFADCLRYALIRTSINSLAGNYVPELAARAVETGLWTVQRGLSIAANIPDAEKKVKLLRLLLGTGKLTGVEINGVQQQALSSALAMQDELSRARVLTALAPQLSGEGLAQALSAALAMQDELSRSRALAALALQLGGTARQDALVQALSAALAIQDAGARAEALTALALQLEGTARQDALVQALNAVLAMQDEWSRARALAALAPQLSGEGLTQGLSAALAMQDEWSRAIVVAALAPQFDGEARQDVLAQELHVALALQNEEPRAKELAALAPQLSSEQLAQGLSAALALQNERYRAIVLAALAPQLDGEGLAQGLSAALAMQNEESCAIVLAALVPQLDGEGLAQGLSAARAIQDAGARARVLAALAPQLEGITQQDVLAQGLNAACAVKYELSRAKALATLAPRLSSEQLAQGLNAARAIQDAGARAEALTALAPQLSSEQLAQGLSAARALQDAGARAEALTSLAPQLEQTARQDALAQGLNAALAIQYEELRAKALAALAPQLDDEGLAQGLSAALAIQDEEHRVYALAALAPHLKGTAREDALAQGLSVALALQYEKARAEALAALAPHLEGTARQDALAQGLSTALALQYEWERSEALAALAPQLSGEGLAQGLSAALALQNNRDRAEILAALAPHLEGTTRQDALAQGLSAILAIQDEMYRPHALIALAPQLDGEGLAQGLSAALAIQDEEYRVYALAALAPHLEGTTQQDALAQGLSAALAVQDEEYRACALAALAPHLSGEGLAQGLSAALAIQDEEHRAYALTALAPQLDDEGLAQGLSAALALHDEGDRAWTLAAFLPLVDDKLTLIRHIRWAMLGCLLPSAGEKRESILGFCAVDQLFAPPILSPEILAQVAWHIIEICGEWQWL